MESDDLSYYYRRAEREFELAQRAVLPEAVRAHIELADAYLDRIHALSRGDDLVDI